jgi:hypothetical protein
VNSASSALTINANYMNPCTYSLSPGGAGYSGQSATGSFTVTTASACSYHAVPSAPWITILPSASKGTGKVNYAIAANSSGVGRVGAISVGGQTFNIDQAALTCAYSIAPATAAFGATGGSSRVVVSAAAGCPWSATSNVSWLSVTSGASGSGSGQVFVQAAPNSGGVRSGTVTIAGQTFSASQSQLGATACGAADVTSQIPPSIHGITPIFGGISQPVSVTNHTSSTIQGPIYLVTVGEPTHYGNLSDTFLISGGYDPTTCFSSLGDYLIPLTFGGLAPNQTVQVGLSWNAYPSYSPKILSGAPSH